MLNKIDWLSISLPFNNVLRVDQSTQRLRMPEDLCQHIPHLGDFINIHTDLSTGKGRGVFSRSAHSETGGFTIYWRETLPYSLIEITGQGVDNLRRLKLLPAFIRLYGEWLTRIDVATDIMTDVRPHDFATKRDVKRFSSFSHVQSESGETYYVGSKTSDRYARVYRYNAPHPRHELLRIEICLRDGNAKSFAASLQQSKLSTLVAALGKTFGWTHEVWGQHATDSGLRAAPRDTHQGKTERWLFKSVLPAIKRLLENNADEVVAQFGQQVYNLFNEKQQEREHRNESYPVQNRLEDAETGTS